MRQKEIVKEYLKALNIDYKISTLDDITKLLQAHIESFAFASLKVLLREDISLDLESIYQSIVVESYFGITIKI
jgi:arylamine N-acetyltransferase